MKEKTKNTLIRNLILIACFAIIFVLLATQFKFRDQNLAFRKHDDLFDASMKPISELVSADRTVKIHLDGGNFTIEDGPEGYDLSADTELCGCLSQLEEIGICQINAYYFEAKSDYDLPSCEVWYSLGEGKRIIYTEKGRLANDTDLMSDTGAGIKGKEVAVHWLSAVSVEKK